MIMPRDGERKSLSNIRYCGFYHISCWILVSVIAELMLPMFMVASREMAWCRHATWANVNTPYGVTKPFKRNLDFINSCQDKTNCRHVDCEVEKQSIYNNDVKSSRRINQLQCITIRC